MKLCPEAKLEKAVRKAEKLWEIFLLRLQELMESEL